ncbi:T9SS type A sorting domain-containing protein [Flavobacterium soli]|uniref:T9SS type A sorting domain-containing protein n=1 Tax=Flavobacterium soli TaxID=344881 RepID=UPI00040B4097|nr:T9SS type A sorting domain-containing protein [Flavobacterium soli]
MKKITLILFSFFVFLGANAQVGIIEGLNGTTLPAGWTNAGFSNTTTTPCEGSHSWRDNLYSFSATGSLTSPNYVGASNGTDVTVSFQWKATEWSAASGVGFSVVAQYSTDNGANWIAIGDPIVADAITDCATFSAVIPAADLPEGSDFKFRVNETWTAGDCYFWIDNVNITQLTELAPNCDAALVSPVDGSSDANLLGILSWSPATGLPSSYVLSVGTTTGGTDVVNALNVGLSTSYNIPGILMGDTTYYVNITPSNANGVATGCTEYSFTTGPAPIEGALCENAIIVDALPYTTTDNTTNYADVYYEGSPGASGCGSTSSYLNGNDVVYSYTATFTGTMKILLTPEAGNTWGGLFVYGSCSNIGVSCLGGVASSAATPKMIEEFPVTTGETYYIVISTFASPQTIAFTLDLTENTCTNGEATYTVVPNCEEGDEFLVEVNITDLGSATSMSISDDQGSEVQVAEATGVFTFGPYPNTTPVIFNVTNDQDATCFLTSTALTQAVCPPNCEEAVVITACDEEILAELVAGTGAWNVSACGFSTPGTELMYSFTPEETGDYELEVISATGGYIDYFWKDASGTCDNTGWTCIDDINGAGIDPIGTLTAGVEYLFLLDGEGTTAKTHTFKIKCLPTCENGTATYTVVSNCDEGEEFFVEVNITSLGTAESMTITDDQGSEAQVATAIGPFTFGPYPNATPVIFTINNDQDETCFLTSTALTQTVCPPSNDTCAGAIDLTNETSPLMSTTVGATNTNATVCNGSGTEVANTQADVYYSIVVPAGSMLTIGQTLNNYDSANIAFYGDCDNRTSIACFDDNDYIQVEWVNDTGSEQTVYWIQDGWSGAGTFTLEWSVIACTPSEAAYTLVSDCENGEGFLVEVDVTNLGSATSVSVSDDQGSAVQVLTATGVATFGPYPNDTPVIFNVVNDQDANCTLTSPVLNQVACPPVNDNCEGATVITAGAEYGEQIFDTTNIAATGSPQAAPTTCFGYGGADVWYSVEVPPSGNIIIETADSTTGDTGLDTVVTVYSGTCEALVQVGCDDDGAATGAYSKVTVTGQTPGATLYIRAYEYNGGSFGGFGITAYDESVLGNNSFENNGFKAYPNPVRDILNLTYTQNISNVEVFNMLGQQVLAKSVNATQGQIDMSNLSMGTYLVKVTADNQVKTIKVVKQ